MKEKGTNMAKVLNFKQELTGFFGQPASENPTQAMIEAAYRHHGLAWRYLTIEVGPADLGDAVLSTDGTLTRTVEDCARSLDVIAGYEPGDATWAPPPDEPFANALERSKQAPDYWAKTRAKTQAAE